MAYELIKVSELPELTTPSDSNVLPIQDGDYLKRISFESLKEAATGDVADDLAAEVTARESAVSGEATARGNADTAILADLASPYSASATYAVGDYCTKDGVLKRCNTAIATAEAWNSAHWDDAILGGDVSTLRSAFNDINDVLDDVTEAIPSKNLYDKTACNPANSYMYNVSGTYTAYDIYATTGKIPCEAETKYTFSAGSTTIVAVRYFSGENGDTFISGESNVTTFTTPQNCTFVAVNLFGSSHTVEQYNSAIAVAQLEKGAVATEYVPFGDTYTVPLDAVENGDKVGGIVDAVIIQSQVNLYDKTMAEDGKYYVSNNGSVGTNSAYAITGLIPVEPNTQYCFSHAVDSPMSITASCFEFDAEMSYIGRITEMGNYATSYLISFKTGATTKYISFNLYLSSHTTQDYNDTIDTLMLCYGTQRPKTYSAYNPESTVNVNNLSNAYFENAERFNAKVWLATGTSLTAYDSQKYQVGVHTGDICQGYVGNVARRKKLIVVNDGISGATLGNVGQYSLINRYQTLNWADADIATVEFGVNDYGHDVPVGTASDAVGTTTFAACLKTIIEYALAQNPTICLVICTEPDVRGTGVNNNGNTLKDYTDVTLEIAALYRLPVCDWFYHSGINALNKGDQSKDWMTCDGTHPNDAGHLRMGAMLNQTFDELIC